VVFSSSADNLVTGDSNGLLDVFIHDLQTGETRRVSVPNLADQGTLGEEGNSTSSSSYRSISADGRYVTFDSDASNLVSGDDNGLRDIFVHDRLDGTTIRVNLNKAGTQCENNDSHSAYLSADGRYVSFISNDSNLVSNDTNVVGDIFRVLNTTP
jgi:Tol biopolymer transport system component